MPKKGIALFTVLTTVALLLLMLAAFVQINRDHFSMVNNDQRHDAAVDAAFSAFEYSQYRLEHDKYWCGAPFAEDRVDPDVMGVMTLTEIKGTHTLRGKFLRGDATFQIETLNNIAGTVTLDGVPKGSCRVRIKAECGSAVVRREGILVTAPLYDASAISSKGINIEANQLDVASRDPMRNRLRSKGDIKVPNYKHNFTFSPPPKAREKGVLWAYGGIQMGAGHNLENLDTLNDAIKVTKGSFYTRSQTNYEVHDLQISDVVVSENSVTIQGGVYVFSRGAVDYKNHLGFSEKAYIPMLQRRAFAVEDGVLKGGDILEYWYLGNKLPPGHSMTDLVGSTAQGHEVSHMAFRLQPGVGADLDINQMYVDSDMNLTVNGDFGVASDQYDVVPSVVFHDPDTGRLANGSITSSGQIFIEGVVKGSGKLLAAKDVTLMPNFAHLEADPESDLSIFSGGSIRVKPPDNRGIKFGSVFRGLLYAKNDILFDAGERGLWVRGAMVARDGMLNITRGTRIVLDYDPTYLDAIVKQLPEARVRLERALWKEI